MKYQGKSSLDFTVRVALTLIALVAAALVMPFGVQPVSAKGSGDRVALNRDLTVAKGEVVDGDVSVTNGNLTMYGEVHGEVVVMQGNADIEGTVEGDVSVANGNVTLGPQSSVGGDVQALLGHVDRDPKAAVSGEIRAPSLSLSGLGNDVKSAPQVPGKPGPVPAPADTAPASQTLFEGFLNFFAKGLVSLLLLLVGLLIAALMPRRVQIASITLDAEPGPSVVVGLILALMVIPVAFVLTLALLISIVGIVFIPVLWFLVVVGLLFGLVTASGWFGRVIFDSGRPASSLSNSHVVLDVLLGMALVLGATFIPSVLLGGGVTMLMLALIYFTASVGLGSAVLSRAGTLVPPKHAHRFYRVTPGQAMPTVGTPTGGSNVTAQPSAPTGTPPGPPPAMPR